jgi:hypothetical protein
MGWPEAYPNPASYRHRGDPHPQSGLTSWSWLTQGVSAHILRVCAKKAGVRR